jgi:flagellar FliL protein
VTLLVLAGGGFGAWQFFGAKSRAQEARGSAAASAALHQSRSAVRREFRSRAMVRFLQVTIGIMTRDVAVETLVKDNDPRVRNDLLMILGNQTYASVSTAEGKEALRTRCLESVRAIVKEMGGDPKKVEALYFTAFVMQ